MVATIHRGLFCATLFIGVAFLLAISSSAVEAQDATGVVRLEVRYPDGSLVDDAKVCSSAQLAEHDGEVDRTYTAATFFVGHRINEPSGPISQVTVPANKPYVAVAYDCDSPIGGAFATAFHFGPETRLGDLGRNELARNAVMVSPGETVTMSITVGSGEITGTFPGMHICGINVIGQAEFGNGGERLYARGGAVSAASTTYTARVAPGRYRVEADCGSSGVAYHPEGATLAASQYVTVRHGGRVTGVNFGTSVDGETFETRRIEVDEQSKFVSFCLDSVRLDGTLARRVVVGQTYNRDQPEHRAAASVPTSGGYRLRLVDCFGLGFAPTWYPGVASVADATTLAPTDGLGKNLPIVLDVLGSGGANCNGERPTLLGNNGANVFVGTAGRDVIVANGGDDTITGLGGDDIICGGAGNDRILGNAGHDWIDAGAGNDWVGAGWGEDVVFGGAGNDFIRGFKHNDTIYGGAGHDRITGGWGNDILRGGDGNDTLRAYYGADKLFGDAGNDALVAGYGPDFLVGGPGRADRLFGDQGRDTCNDVGAASQFTDCETIN